MITKLRQWLKARQVAGVEVVLLPEGQLRIHLVKTTLKGNLLTLDTQVKELESMQELKAHLSVQVPISLAVNGKGILHKKLTNGGEQNPEGVVNEVLPNAKGADFYLQQYPVHPHQFASIIRKSTLEAILALFQAAGFWVVEVSLGPFAVGQLQPLLGDSIRDSIGDSIRELSFAGHHLQFDSQGLTQYAFRGKDREKDDEAGEIMVDQESLDERLLVAYAAGFQTLFPNPQSVSLTVEKVKEQKEEFRQKNRFKIYGYSGLLGFFFLLTFNFLAFNHLSDQNKRLVKEETRIRSLVVQADSLQKQIAAKEGFLAHSGWLRAPKASFYADRIAVTVPASIRLTGLAVHPQEEKGTQPGKNPRFLVGVIRLTGNCGRPTDLNPWIRQLQSYDWVRQVEIQNYAFDQKNASGSFLMSLQTN